MSEEGHDTQAEERISVFHSEVLPHDIMSRPGEERGAPVILSTPHEIRMRVSLPSSDVVFRAWSLSFPAQASWGS